ncbi:MAG: DUF6178 family protein, partial [Deltaproteobacteria bacterium]|nr:DUF6178 family protein [Deltaproteobacteria bacterium]
DGLYYISPLCDEEKSLLVKEILTLIFEKDHNLYLRLLEGVRNELLSVLEEDLYRIRSSRITELGFYEYEEAIGLYSEPTNIKREIIPERIEQYSYSRLPVRYMQDILAAQSETIDERTALEILFELQILINRLIVADRLEMFETESLEMSAGKVKSVLKLGLDVIKSEMNIEWQEAIKIFYVIDIFRHGYRKLKFLRDEARRIRSLHQYLKHTELPLYFEGLLRIADANFAKIDMREIFSDAVSEYPESLEEIQKLHNLLLELEASLDILIKCYDIQFDDIAKFDHRKTNIPGDSKPTLFNLLMTPVVNSLLGKGLRYIAVNRNELAEISRSIFIRREEGNFLSDDFLRMLEDNIFSKLRDNARYQYARRIMGRALEEFISELGGVQDFSSIKPCL